MTLVPQYGGPLKRDLIQMAYEECGQAGYEFDIEPEQYAYALRRLDALMAQWQARGIDLGYAFPDTGPASAQEESGIPFSAMDTVGLALAMSLAPGIGKTMAPEAKARLAQGMALLPRQAPQPMQLGRQTIRGAGNRWGYGWRDPFFPISPVTSVPVAPITPHVGPTPSPSATPTPSPTPTPTPTTTPSFQRLAFSQPVNKNTAVPTGTTLSNRVSGSTLTTSIPGLTINSATGGVSGTPTALSGLITEHRADGTKRNTFVYMPKAAQRRMRIGTGVAGSSFFTPNIVWIDYFKAGQWSTPPATQDANGMPVTLTGNRAVYYLPYDDGSVTPVKYRIITDGDFDVQDFTRDGDDLVRTWTESSGVEVIFSNVRRAPSRMAFVREEHAALFRAGEMFKPDYLAELGKYAWVRWMNVNGGNLDHPIPDNPNSLSYARESIVGGVPLSCIAHFHKKTGAGLYLNVHIDETPQSFAANIKPTLIDLISHGIEVYCEYSNEVWNGGFGQYGKAVASAKAAGYQGDYGYATSYWVGIVTAQLAKDCRGTGIRWLIGTQTGLEQGQYGLFVPLIQGMDTVSGRQDSDVFAYIMSGYASGSLYNPAVGGDQQIAQAAWVATGDHDSGFDNLINYVGPVQNQSVSTSAEWLRGIAAANKQQADARGWQLMVYEGNLDMPGPSGGGVLERYLFAMFHDDLYAPALEALLETYEEAGCYGFTQFDFGLGTTAQNVLNNSLYDLYGLPGYAGLVDYRDTTDDTGGLGPRVTIDNAVTRSGQAYTFTARRNITSGTLTRTISLAASATNPAATAADFGGAFPSQSITFADGAATASVTFTVPATVQPE